MRFPCPVAFSVTRVTSHGRSRSQCESDFPPLGGSHSHARLTALTDSAGHSHSHAQDPVPLCLRPTLPISKNRIRLEGVECANLRALKIAVTVDTYRHAPGLGGTTGRGQLSAQLGCQKIASFPTHLHCVWVTTRHDKQRPHRPLTWSRGLSGAWCKPRASKRRHAGFQAPQRGKGRPPCQKRSYGQGPKWKRGNHE